MTGRKEGSVFLIFFTSQCTFAAVYILEALIPQSWCTEQRIITEVLRQLLNALKQPGIKFKRESKILISNLCLSALDNIGNVDFHGEIHSLKLVFISWIYRIIKIQRQNANGFETSKELCLLYPVWARVHSSLLHITQPFIKGLLETKRAQFKDFMFRRHEIHFLKIWGETKCPWRRI